MYPCSIVTPIVKEMTRAQFAKLYDETNARCFACSKSMCNKLDTIKKHYIRRHSDLMHRIHTMDSEMSCLSNNEIEFDLNALIEELQVEAGVENDATVPAAKRTKVREVTEQTNHPATITQNLEIVTPNQSVSPALKSPLKSEQPAYYETLQKQLETALKSKNLTVSDHVLALFTASNAPLELTENTHFVALCNAIPNFAAPTINALKESIANIATNGAEFLRREVFSKNKPFSVVCGVNKHDTGFNMVMNVHFYDAANGAVTNQLLDVIYSPDLPNATRINETVICNLNAHGADLKCFVKLVLDYGANLVPSFIPTENIVTCNDVTKIATKTLISALPSNRFNDYAEFLTSSKPSFPKHGFSGHYDCAAHRLQTALDNVLDKNFSVSTLKETVFSFLLSVVNDPAFHSELMYRSEKGLLYPCQANWIVYNKSFARILELQKILAEITTSIGFQFLNADVLEMLKNIVEFIVPIDEFIAALEATPSGGVSLLLGGLNGLLELYSHMFKNTTKSIIKSIVGDLIIEIKSRFKDVLESLNSNGDPMFAAACLLNPLVANDFPSQDSGVKVDALVRAFAKYCDPTPEPIDSKTAIKRKSVYGFSTPLANNTPNNNRPNPIVSEAEAFIRVRAADFGEVDAWKVWAGLYPRLSKLASLLFVVPATSSSANAALAYWTALYNSQNPDMELTRKRTLVTYNMFR